MECPYEGFPDFGYLDPFRPQAPYQLSETQSSNFHPPSLGYSELLGPTAAQIAAFLYYLFDTHSLSPQTIKGYRTCLASVLSCMSKTAVVQAKTISDMITSMELKRPRITPVLPQWNLGIVPEALNKPPYEPLREASLKHVTLKIVFLIAMALAGRHS